MNDAQMAEIIAEARRIKAENDANDTWVSSEELRRRLGDLALEEMRQGLYLTDDELDALLAMIPDGRWVWTSNQ